MSQSTTSRRPTGWAGWTAFATSMLLVLGTFNLIYGFAAVFKDRIFVGSDDLTVVLDITAWGWIHVVVGVLQLAAGLGLAQGAAWAVMTATFLVLVNMITHMAVLPAFPVWSVVVIALDAFVLWALTVHGNDRTTGL